MHYFNNFCVKVQSIRGVFQNLVSLINYSTSLSLYSKILHKIKHKSVNSTDKMSAGVERYPPLPGSRRPTVLLRSRSHPDDLLKIYSHA